MHSIHTHFHDIILCLLSVVVAVKLIDHIDWVFNTSTEYYELTMSGVRKIITNSSTRKNSKFQAYY